MNKLKITTGEWRADRDEITPYYVFAGEDGTVCCLFSNEKEDARYDPTEDIVTMEERRGHAKLIADAGNAYQKCGLMPSELLEALKKTRKYLIMLLIVFWMMNLCVLVVGIRL